MRIIAYSGLWVKRLSFRQVDVLVVVSDYDNTGGANPTGVAKEAAHERTFLVHAGPLLRPVIDLGGLQMGYAVSTYLVNIG